MASEGTGTLGISSNETSHVLTEEVGTKNPLESFLHRLSGQEREPDLIAHDHNYARPWNARPDNLHAKPAKMLFMDHIKRFHGVPTHVDEDAEIDVESESSGPLPPFDLVPTVDESTDLANLLRGPSALEEHEDKINKTGWTYAQGRLFSKAMKILNNDRLSRLTHEGSAIAALHIQLTAERTSNKFRALFASTFWDMKLLSWLHTTLVDHLSTFHLNVYLGVLHKLKQKIPTLIEKMLLGSQIGQTTLDILSQHVQPPADPIVDLIQQHYKPVKLPGPPVIILVPHIGPPCPRQQFWQNQLTAFGKVVPIWPPNSALTTDACLEAIVTSIKTKISEVKSSFPNRPIVLIGWHIGGLIACHVSLVENVSAVVSLGFPVTGVRGSRGQLDDPLLDARTPTLFVVGQNAATCGLDDIEDLRARRRGESGLIVVGAADDLLRVGGLRRRLGGITQTMVDRCILDEIGYYLKEVLSRPPQSAPSPPPPTSTASTMNSGNIVNSVPIAGNRVAHFTSTGDVFIKRKYKRRAPKDQTTTSKFVPKRKSISPVPSSSSTLSPTSKLPSQSTTGLRNNSTDTSSTASSNGDLHPSPASTLLPPEASLFRRRGPAGRRPGRPPNTTRHQIGSRTGGLSISIGSLSSLGQFRQQQALAEVNEGNAMPTVTSLLNRPPTPLHGNASTPTQSPQLQIAGSGILVTPGETTPLSKAQEDGSLGTSLHFVTTKIASGTGPQPSTSGLEETKMDHGYSNVISKDGHHEKPTSPSSTSSSLSSGVVSPNSSPTKAWMAFPSATSTRTRKVRAPKFMDM